MGAAGWALVAFAYLGLRVADAVAVGARWGPAWSGPVVEVLLWIGGPAILDPAALDNVAFWLGLAVLLLLWSPAVALTRRPRPRRTARAALIMAAVLALAVQAAATQQGLVAGTVNEATAGQACQFPRKVVVIDLNEAHAGALRDGLATYISHARRTGGGRARRPAAPTSPRPASAPAVVDREQNKAKEWATRHGHPWPHAAESPPRSATRSTAATPPRCRPLCPPLWPGRRTPSSARLDPESA